MSLGRVLLLTVAVTAALWFAARPVAAQSACELDGRSTLTPDVPQATVIATFAAAGQVFSGVGDSATLLVGQAGGHRIYLTVLVIAETSPGFFTVRETISVTGCIAAPALSECALGLALAVLMAIAGGRLRRSSRPLRLDT